MAKGRCFMFVWDGDKGEDVPIARIIRAARKYPDHKLFYAGDVEQILILAPNKKAAEDFMHRKDARYPKIVTVIPWRDVLPQKD